MDVIIQGVALCYDFSPTAAIDRSSRSASEAERRLAALS
jgi:hypothetical protein